MKNLTIFIIAFCGALASASPKSEYQQVASSAQASQQNENIRGYMENALGLAFINADRADETVPAITRIKAGKIECLFNNPEIRICWQNYYGFNKQAACVARIPVFGANIPHTLTKPDANCSLR